MPVFAVTSDFWDEADLKGDSEIPEWLRERGKSGDEELARDAELGMKILRQGKMNLRPAKPDELVELQKRVRTLHSIAFGWDAPEPRDPEELQTRSVREYVKSWITELDMMLLYPDYRPKIVAEKVIHEYSEEPELSPDEEETNGGEEY